MKKSIVLAALLIGGLSAAEPLRCAKIADNVPRIPLPVQNEKYPAGAKAFPYKEFAPDFVPTAAESEAGMALFTRPLTEAIWAETKPLPFERVTELSGYGAQKQFVTLNFAVLPLKDLKNLKVRFQGNVQPEIRIVRYWDIIYPRYSSYSGNPKVKLYQRMPEFLAPFTSGDFSAKEPQRFCLTFQLPVDAKEVKGDVLIFHDEYGKALKLPLSIRILPFELKQDPNKHYSAYYISARNWRSPFFIAHKNNKELLHKVQLAEFRRMREYGFTRPPCLNITWGKLPGYKEESFIIPDYDEMMAELKEAGFDPKAAIPAPGPSMVWEYQRFTKHQMRSFHMDDIQCDKIPEALYTHVEKALTNFLDYAKKNNYPPIIFNPIDEPSPQSFPYVKRIYEIFKKHGCTVFQTSPGALAKEADHLFDIYNYGAFNVPYETATSGKKKEYWCYPNDNAFQIKDPDVMCHGGRMTYGLGYWRSGFHCIIPWIWGNNNPKRLGNSGGVLRIEDGSILIPTYWECFRLGVDDERYIYTLQDAVVKRENSSAPEVRKAVKKAKEILQSTWNAICPQSAYLRENLMHHAELEARRAEIAAALVELKKYPETNAKNAASVIIDSKGKYEPEKPLESGSKLTRPLNGWTPVCKELTMEKIPTGLQVNVNIDHKLVGEGYGKTLYPIGWPRICHNFSKKDGDFTPYTHLEFDLTVSSNRDAENDYKWPIRMTIYSKNGERSGMRISSFLEPNVKHKIRLPLDKLMSFSHEAMKQVGVLQIVFDEANYPHGVKLSMKFENIRATGFSSPTVTFIDAPALLALPCNSVSVPVSVNGVPENSVQKVHATLLDSTGKTVEESTAPVCVGKALCGFPCKNLKAGVYTIRCKLSSGSELEKQIRVIDGPGKGR